MGDEGDRGGGNGFQLDCSTSSSMVRSWFGLSQPIGERLLKIILKLNLKCDHPLFSTHSMIFHTEGHIRMGINRISSRLDWINLLNRYIVAPSQDSAITLNAINQIRVVVYTKLYGFY